MSFLLPTTLFFRLMYGMNVSCASTGLLVLMSGLACIRSLICLIDDFPRYISLSL